MTKPDVVDREWHLDKKVPIALICALLGQTFVIGWWTSRIDSRVAMLEENKLSSSNQASQLSSIAIDMASLKEKASATNDDVSDIKRSVEMLMQQVLQEKKR